MNRALLVGLIAVGVCGCVSGASKDKAAPPTPRDAASAPLAASTPPAPVEPPGAPGAPVDPPPPIGTGGHMVANRYYVDSSGPDPLACKEDKDCIADTVTDAKGCCIESSRAWPQSWAYHTWLSTRRRAASVCKAMTCPQLGTPSPPSKCEIDLKCVASKCQNSCKTP
jgi:hypothetical protein